MFGNLNTFKEIKDIHMDLTPGKLNKFLLLKLPSAWVTGVRVKEFNEKSCRVGIKHRWINQNPFNSLYFAVQAMAAELSTGALVMGHIRESGKRISMLVAQNKSTFTKKATGRIMFECKDGNLLHEAVQATIATGEGQTIWMKSIGTNEEGVEVSTFEFQWTLKLKK